MTNKLKLFIGCKSIQTFHHLNPIEKKIEGVDIDHMLKGDIEIKPILKSLMDITEEDFNRLIWTRYGDLRINTTIVKKDAISVDYKYYHVKFKAQGVNTVWFDKLSADQVVFLAERSYDLFDWIQSGKAVDEKEINNTKS